MKKQQKKQIAEIIETLKEANSEIVRLFLVGNISSVMALLIESQNIIMKTGKFIEDLEGEGTKTVALLENYYENLYGIAAEIETLDISFADSLDQMLKRIKSSVDEEFIPDRLEIIFLPYNASMWDSLESIWLVAKEDPQCDVYCVPIPYYAIKSDGQLGEMYYDGGEHYGPHVEITSWQKYDMKARHPDVIFTHYAYDDMARNATIHPDFYSKNLREQCEHLVYVPYFITPYNTVEEYSAYLPGVLYADSVIVQSKEIRQSYIGHYKKFDKENQLNFCFGKAEDKFIAMGSPKYDKAINSRDIDYELLADWKQLIYNEDGEKKKIIFYNTHMFTWLNGGESYFKKMHAVFETFKQRKDVVLWWRPHPNTELNFRAFRPDLLSEYLKTIENYKREGWGIYDDTADLHRAVAWSDLYYGDCSSVTELFTATGKAVYFQNIAADADTPIEMLESFGFHTTDLFETYGELRAVTFDGYLFNLKEKRFEYESEIAASPGLPRNRNYFTQIVADGNIVFIPHNDNQIAVYNMEDKGYKLYPLELKDEYLAPLNTSNRNFFDGIIYKNKLFLVPCAYRNMVAFHLDTNETEHCLDLLQLFPKEKVTSLCYGWTWLNENTILLASLYTNEVLEFNLDTYGYKVHKLGGDKQSFHSIFKYGNDFFLVGRQPFVMKWNYETGTIVTYDKLPRSFKIKRKQEWVFSANNIKPYKNKLILIGGFTNMVLEFDLDTYEFRKLDAFNEILNSKLKEESNATLSFSTSNFMSDRYLYFIHKNEMLYRYDIETQTLDAVCDLVPTLNADAWNALNNRFVDRMLKGENSQAKIGAQDKLQDGQSGKRIYDYIKKRWLEG